MFCTEDMWSEIVEFLKDASLVAKIQKIFGVKIHYRNNLNHFYDKHLNNETRDTDIQKPEHGLNKSPLNCGESKENGHSSIERKFSNTASICTSSDQQEQLSPVAKNSNYTITNYFWYYLFLFGTELGDEVFYSTFIPFWFWNIDGAVGRRVVLVWAIIMTTGKLSIKP